MNQPTNAQIARNENLWNEFYNISALPENEFSALTQAERKSMLDLDYPEEEKKAGKKAEKKAGAYHGDGPKTAVRKIKHPTPTAFVELGEIVAIEYKSTKWDGEPRIFRHEFTRVRELHMSTDGGTIAIVPPCKLTKRGIEG